MSFKQTLIIIAVAVIVISMIGLYYDEHFFDIFVMWVLSSNWR